MSPMSLSRGGLGGPIALACLLATLLGAAQPAPVHEVPGEPPATLVWPLGLDGNVPRVLYTSHGEWIPDRKGNPYGHAGIDMGATPGSEVFAMEDGTVVAQDLTSDIEDQWLIVSRGTNLVEGLKYAHLKNAQVKVGDAVVRDQQIAEVARFDLSCGYDHLHVQVLHDTSAERGREDAWSLGFERDDGNALLLFASRNDDLPPTFEPMPTQDGGSDELLFLEDASGNELASGATIAGPVDIVAKVHEHFPGNGPVYVEHGPPCDHPPPADVLAPLRIDLRILRIDETATVSAAGAPPPEATAPYENRIDFSGSVSPDATASIRAYHASTVGTYTERDLRFVLTHDQETGTGCWSPTADGTYVVEVVAMDASHNATSLVRVVQVQLPSTPP